MAAVSMGLASCGDDDNYDVVGNPANLVYFNIAHDYPANMPKNTFAYTVYHTPVGSSLNSGPGQMDLYVTSTKVASHDITVNVELLPQETVEGYASIPADAGFSVTLPSTTLTIPAGSNVSNSVTLSVNTSATDWSKFTEESYLLPIRISSVNGAESSVEKNYAYIGINTDVKDGMLDAEADVSSVEGLTMIQPASSWTCFIDCPDKGVEKADVSEMMFDSNPDTYLFLKNAADGLNMETTTTIDFGQTQKVSAIMFNYYFRWYTVKDATLYTTVDGETWVNQGTLSWNSDTYQRYFVFWAPMEIRGVRVVGHSYYGGTGEGQCLTDVYVF